MSPDEYAGLLRQILSLFVAHPSDLRISTNWRAARARGGGMLDLLVRGHSEDQGRLIGDGGRNAIAFQTVLNAISSRHDVRLFVQVLEPDDAGQSVNVPFVPSRDASRDDQIKTLLTTLSQHLFDQAKVSAVPARNADKTDFYVQIDGTLDPSTEASLARIFRGIGKNMGRMVGLHICLRESNPV